MANTTGNVVFLTTAREVVGGAEESVLGVLKYYPKDRLSPVLVGPPGGEMERQTRAMNIGFQPWDPPALTLGLHPRKWAGQRRALKMGLEQLAHTLDPGRPRLLTSHSLEAHMFAAMRSRSTRERVVWHIRDLLPHWGIRTMFYVAETLGRVTPVFVSKATQGRFYGRGTGPVLNDGLDWDRFSNSSPVPPATPVFAYVGQLLPRKGLGWLLEAWAQFSPQVPGAKLWIIGEGAMGFVQELEAQAASLNKSVEFLGYRQDVEALLQQCTALVLPSRDEALGLVILEAMACSVPVIGTPDSGMAELIRHGESGFLVPFEQPDTLSAVMLEIVNNPERTRRIASRGYAFAKEMYNAETQAQRMAVYHEKVFLES